MENKVDTPKTSTIFGSWSRSKIIVIFIGLLLLIPYKTIIVSEWKLRAIDDNGNPVPHARFRQGWDNYSYDIHGCNFWKAMKMVL